MWRAIYRTQGGRTAFVIALVYAAIAQLLPLAFLGEEIGLDLRNVDIYRLGSVANMSGMFMSSYAAIAGFTCAVACWTADQNTNHVYALSLPIDRSRYAFMRWAMGLMHVAFTVLMFYIVGVILSIAVTLPQGLYAYPGALATRFGLATFMAYSISYGLYTVYLNLPQRQRYTAILAVAGIIIVATAAMLANPQIGRDASRALVNTSWSPFHFVSGTWALFDV